MSRVCSNLVHIRHYPALVIRYAPHGQRDKRGHKQTFPLHQEEEDIYCPKLCHVSQSQDLTEEHNNSWHYCFSLIRSIKRIRQRQPSIAGSILRRVPSSGPLNECALAFFSPPPRAPYTAADAINFVFTVARLR
jgi:hypothetical protein